MTDSPTCVLCDSLLCDEISVLYSLCGECRLAPPVVRVCRSCLNSGLNVVEEPCTCSIGRGLRGLPAK